MSSTLITWLQMGGHGPYIWASYFFCLVVLSVLFLTTKVRKKRALQEAKSRLL